MLLADVEIVLAQDNCAGVVLYNVRYTCSRSRLIVI